MSSSGKPILKAIFAGVLYYSGLLYLRTLLRRMVLGKEESCVLGLHRVLSASDKGQENSQAAIVLKEETFVRLLEFLRRKFKLVTLRDFLEGQTDVGSPPYIRCLLTFDDGWRDNYTTAYPWLKKYKIPAVIFLPTGLIGSNVPFWVEQVCKAWRDPDRRGLIATAGNDGDTQDEKVSLDARIEHLKRMPASRRAELLHPILAMKEPDLFEGDKLMNWVEVGEMVRGDICFGSHTVNHPLLTFEEDHDAAYEISASKEFLESKLGTSVTAFAYPNGDWNEKVRAMVERAGYTCAFTTEPGWHCQGDDAFTIRRVLIHEGNCTGIRGTFSPAVFSLTLARGY